MRRRTLGRTGIQVGEIGMGCEGFVGKSYEQVKEFVDFMEENGVNCIDLYAPNPEMRDSLGRALQAGGRNLSFRPIYVRFGRTVNTSGPGIWRRSGRALAISCGVWGPTAWRLA